MQSLEWKINADSAEVKGEEAPKGGLQRKINADSAEVKGEEAPKGGLQWKNVDLRQISFCITSHHLHSITSYIILHQWYKKGIQCWSSKNDSKKWNCAKAQNKFSRNTASSALMWRKKSIVDEALMFLPRLEDFLWSIKALLYEAWKEGKVFFSPKA